MSLNTRNAKEYQRTRNYKCHKINLSGAFGVFLSYVILSNHLLLAGVKNRNVIITQRFHAAPDQANRDCVL